ncbi:hypothetical protein NDU88_000999 [Pleurodeles waltl]|uniref:Uncharacterized protein n=1 Tax=Pleurodeles waltl TaxID=8319 RepID=A0AAV7V6Y9_PLEWA|nr:hypothetical protein NDU88_000999 [Pleurodeles waltl]
MTRASVPTPTLTIIRAVFPRSARLLVNVPARVYTRGAGAGTLRCACHEWLKEGRVMEYPGWLWTIVVAGVPSLPVVTTVPLPRIELNA